jgi:hypothetical protein
MIGEQLHAACYGLLLAVLLCYLPSWCSSCSWLSTVSMLSCCDTTPAAAVAAGILQHYARCSKQDADWPPTIPSADTTATLFPLHMFC